ncbi:MAG: hypothetical protein IIT58_11215, partial [Treponema sp.]|nr:hypothetical protein [Treponema sp.]
MEFGKIKERLNIDSRILKRIVLVLLLVFSFTGAWADTYVWTGNTDVEWDRASNWTVDGNVPSDYPSSTDDVEIPSGTTSNIEIKSKMTVKSFTILPNAKVTISSAKLIVSETLLNKSAGASSEPGLKIKDSGGVQGNIVNDDDSTIDIYTSCYVTGNIENRTGGVITCFSGNTITGDIVNSGELILTANTITGNFTNNNKVTFKNSAILNGDYIEVGECQTFFETTTGGSSCQITCNGNVTFSEDRLNDEEDSNECILNIKNLVEDQSSRITATFNKSMQFWSIKFGGQIDFVIADGQTISTKSGGTFAIPTEFSTTYDYIVNINGG